MGRNDEAPKGIRMFPRLFFFGFLLLIPPRFFLSRLFPYGFPSPTPTPTYSKVDTTNDKLTFKHGKLQKIYERVNEAENGDGKLLRSPETVVFGPDGTMYTCTDEGYLISLTDFVVESPERVTAKTTLVKDLGPGRPLGAKFTPDGNSLYIADAVLGLLRVQDPLDPESKVEIVASAVMDNGRRTRLHLADDVVVGPKTGRVYFTDATDVSPPRNEDYTYDVIFASKVASMRAPTGRLLQYDPLTDEVSVLARNLWFANGIGIDKDETYVVVAETFGLSIVKYHLTGEKTGTMEFITGGAPPPAYFDGVDCGWEGVTAETSYCFATNPSSVTLAHKLLWKIPHPLDLIVTSLLFLLPKEALPHTKPYGGITVFDAETATYIGLIQDPTGADIGHLTGVTVHENKLFLGSLENDFIGIYALA